MFKTLSKVVIVLIAIVVVSYFLQNKGETVEDCIQIEGYWNTSEQHCEQKTDKMIFDSLLKPHPLTITYPNNERLVVLDNAEQVDDAIYLRGFYSELIKGKAGTKSAVYDRGAIFFNLSQLTVLDSNREGITYFSAPFEVNTAGKGIFTYVGLFSYDLSTQKSQHLASALLGNRVREVDIKLMTPSVVKNNVFVQEGMIKVSFKSHLPTQAAAEYPAQLNEKVLQLVALDAKDDKNATFRDIDSLDKRKVLSDAKQ